VVVSGLMEASDSESSVAVAGLWGVLVRLLCVCFGFVQEREILVVSTLALSTSIAIGVLPRRASALRSALRTALLRGAGGSAGGALAGFGVGDAEVREGAVGFGGGADLYETLGDGAGGWTLEIVGWGGWGLVCDGGLGFEGGRTPCFGNGFYVGVDGGGFEDFEEELGGGFVSFIVAEDHRQPFVCLQAEAARILRCR